MILTSILFFGSCLALAKSIDTTETSGKRDVATVLGVIGMIITIILFITSF